MRRRLPEAILQVIVLVALGVQIRGCLRGIAKERAELGCVDDYDDGSGCGRRQHGPR